MVNVQKSSSSPSEDSAVADIQLDEPIKEQTQEVNDPESASSIQDSLTESYTKLNLSSRPTTLTTDNGTDSNDPGKMFIGGLNPKTNPESLRDYFGKYGEIREFMIMRDPQTQRSRGFGFVTFTDPNCVEKVLLDTPHILDSKKIPSHRKRVFIGGVAAHTDTNDLCEYFNQFGKIESCELMMDKITNRHRGFGFITFESEDAAEQVCSMHFHDVHKKTIEAKHAVPKENMTSNSLLYKHRNQFFRTSFFIPVTGLEMPPSLLSGLAGTVSASSEKGDYDPFLSPSVNGSAAGAALAAAAAAAGYSFTTGGNGGNGPASAPAACSVGRSSSNHFYFPTGYYLSPGTGLLYNSPPIDNNQHNTTPLDNNCCPSSSSTIAVKHLVPPSGLIQSNDPQIIPSPVDYCLPIDLNSLVSLSPPTGPLPGPGLMTTTTSQHPLVGSLPHSSVSSPSSSTTSSSDITWSHYIEHQLVADSHHSSVNYHYQIKSSPSLAINDGNKTCSQQSYCLTWPEQFARSIGDHTSTASLGGEQVHYWSSAPYPPPHAHLQQDNSSCSYDLATYDFGQLSSNNLMSKQTGFSFLKGIPFRIRWLLEDDEWVYDEEPHVARRKEILKKHPEIKDLMGPDPVVAVYITLEVVFQLFMATLISIWQPPWLIWLLLTYAVSGTINHSLGCAIHEVGHNLAFGHKYGTANRLLSLFCNLPMAVPLAISYKKYHQDHHRWLGHEDSDSDMPMRLEAKLFTHFLSRAIWLLIHPLFYAFRPFLKAPRPVTLWELVNMLVQLTFDAVLIRVLGWQSFGYLLLGTLLGLGPHPMTGHFISEHYLFADQQATHSYYGSFNPLIYNLGYHVEHHDFPYIAYTRLPKLKEIAPEYYAHLPYHTSLCRVIFDFLFYPENGPQAHCVTSQNVSRPKLYENCPKGLVVDYYEKSEEHQAASAVKINKSVKQLNCAPM